MRRRAHRGLRPADNPFRSARIEALAFRDPHEPDAPDGSDVVERVLERWRRLGRRGVLVGPKGHGKTTLLEQLERRLEATGREIRRLRLRVDAPSLDRAARRRLTEGLDENVVLSIDGLELLRPWTFWRLRRAWRRAGGVLATAHRRSLLPFRLPTLHEHRTTPDLLRSLVRELLATDDGPDGAAWRSVERRLEGLFARHRGNLRECLRELYDDFAAGPRRG